MRLLQPALFQAAAPDFGADQAGYVIAPLAPVQEAAGSSLSQVLKCNVYCVPGAARFAAFNAVYDRFFPKDAPSRIFMYIHSWPGPFDLEIDCVAVAGSR
jgi:2-iminobutanoate/2-iminopropanoate deaminase